MKSAPTEINGHLAAVPDEVVQHKFEERRDTEKQEHGTLAAGQRLGGGQFAAYPPEEFSTSK